MQFSKETLKVGVMTALYEVRRGGKPGPQLSEAAADSPAPRRFVGVMQNVSKKRDARRFGNI